jgi:hypothetical protein
MYIIRTRGGRAIRPNIEIRQTFRRLCVIFIDQLRDDFYIQDPAGRYQFGVWKIP